MMCIISRKYLRDRVNWLLVSLHLVRLLLLLDEDSSQKKLLALQCDCLLFDCENQPLIIVLFFLAALYILHSNRCGFLGILL